MLNTGPETVVLSPVLDLLAAEQLCRRLRAKILAGEELVIDCRQVERIATACVQLLVAARSSAWSRGLSFRFVNLSAALTEAFADLGLADLLVGQEA